MGDVQLGHLPTPVNDETAEVQKQVSAPRGWKGEGAAGNLKPQRLFRGLEVGDFSGAVFMT